MSVRHLTKMDKRTDRLFHTSICDECNLNLDDERCSYPLDWAIDHMDIWCISQRVKQF